VYWFKVRSKTD